MGTSEFLTSKKREANFEILRVIAILMVLILHYLSHADALLKIGVPASANQIAGQLIESFCIVAVNVWVLISGYFLSRSELKITRILQLIAEVYFYTLGVTVVMQLVQTASVADTDRIYKTAQFIFPISSEHYSFATAYVLLYMIAPVLNKGVKYMTRKQIKLTIMGLLLWFCVIKSVIPVNFATDKMGYNLDWYICLYLIAAYIRKYNVRILTGAFSSGLLYLFSSLISFGIAFAFHQINLTTGRFNYYAGVTLHYNFILCLTGALGLFSMFRYLKVREGILARTARILAPFSFGVYLLHEHLEIRDKWLTWLSGVFGLVPKNPAGMIGHMLICVLFLFACCIFVDWIRSETFKFIGRICGNTRLFRFLGKIDKDLRTETEGTN